MIPFPLLLAWREGRAGVRRIGIYGLSIALGVAALVAVHSFREDVSRSIRAEARALMGADVQLESSRAMPDSVTAIVDSLLAAGHASADVVTAVSMVSAPRSGAVRLLQIRGVASGWPFYGDVETEPAGAWLTREGQGSVLVDRAVLTQLGIEVGDTITVGAARFEVSASVDDLPTDLGFQAAVAPRVWLTPEAMAATGILSFGSLARYETFLRLPEREDQGALSERYGDLLREAQVGLTTAEERARNLTRAVGFLGRYLGLVGLGALLLGGLGVASAIHVFVRERLTQVAVLRCIGARQNGLFGAYLLQAAMLGLLGAAAGAATGVAVQHLLPGLLAGVLPVDVTPQTSWLTVGAGLLIGLWVACVFALLPLLEVRNVPPLRALRQDVEGSPGAGRLARMLALGALASSVVALSVLEAPSVAEGVGFAVALAVVFAALWIVGLAAIYLAKRLFPDWASYPIRQGFSNLFRPRNQTVGVTLALGFGAFVVGTLLQVESNLAREFALDAGEGQPNLLLFDIQSDQREGVLELLPAEAQGHAEVTPLVPARLAAINGRTVAELRRLEGADRPAGWALRRDYRHTWREELSDAEELVAGDWWPNAPAPPEGFARTSLELDLAEDLGVEVGDTVAWAVAGVEVSSVVTSLRIVDWGRFQTNFFVVFEPGGLLDAPATWVVLATVETPEGRAEFQRDLVSAYPNVSVLDVSRIQRTIEDILARVDRAVRFLAGFAAVAGLLVLAGALATSRHQRLREGALLKTLGARRRQLLTVLFAEFLALGSLASLAGLGLAVAAAAALVRTGFGLAFRPEWSSLGAIWLGIAFLTVLTGMTGSRGLLRRPPLPVLRELAD